MIELTGKELIAKHNALAVELGKPELTSWKKAKSLLVQAIEALQKEHDALIAQAKKEKASEEKVETPKRTIREASLELLCAVAYYENRDEKAGDDNQVDASHPRARSVGLPYNIIVDKIREEFDGAQTSVACLRWYAVKVRAEDLGYENYVLPSRRPRAVSKTKGEK